MKTRDKVEVAFRSHLITAIKRCGFKGSAQWQIFTLREIYVLGKRQNRDRLIAGVWNGPSKRQDPDRIPAGVQNGLEKQENPDRISAGVWNGLGKRENPYRISDGVQNRRF